MKCMIITQRLINHKSSCSVINKTKPRMLHFMRLKLPQKSRYRKISLFKLYTLYVNKVHDVNFPSAKNSSH